MCSSLKHPNSHSFVCFNLVALVDSRHDCTMRPLDGAGNQAMSQATILQYTFATGDA